MTSRFRQNVITVVLYACAASSQAQQAGMDEQSAVVPKWETQNGISFACGGIGADEASAMKGEASRHDLMVSFADAKGDFLGEAHVTIADSRGRQLLDTSCGGPIMLADVPKSGRYRVQADIAGQATGGTVEVRHRAGAKVLPLVWPRQ